MELHEFLRPYKKAALIYRGGLCSAYLLYAAAACRDKFSRLVLACLKKID